MTREFIFYTFHALRHLYFYVSAHPQTLKIQQQMQQKMRCTAGKFYPKISLPYALEAKKVQKSFFALLLMNSQIVKI